MKKLDNKGSKMKPRISIITVSYNSAKHIEETIKSVIEQSYDNVEYIIIDGGSTDGTVEIIKKYINQIAYFVSEPDNGISDAFNKGIRASTGEMIGIVNSEDMLYNEDVLEKVASFYSDNIDLFRGSEIVRNFDTGYEYLLEPTMTIKKSPLLFHVCHMGMFINRKAIEKYGLYDVEFRYSMDKELVYRYIYNGASSMKMDVIVGLFRLGGVSQDYSKQKRKESALIVKRTGGSWIQVQLYKISLAIKDAIKYILTRVDPDFARKIRYKK